MTLSFFRRHRTLFLVLMGLGVVGFVGVGAWGPLRERIARWRGTAESRKVLGHVGSTEVRGRDLGRFHSRLKASGTVMMTLYRRASETVESRDARGRVGALTVGVSAWPAVAQDLPAGETPALKPLMKWYALYLEAVERGFQVTPAQIEGRLAALVQAGMPQAELAMILDRVGGPERGPLVEAMQVDQTLRAYVDWLADALATPVEAEVRARVVRMDERVTVRLAVLEAQSFLAQTSALSEAALRRRFEACKAFLPGQGPGGGGYRIPDQVAIEYLVAAPDAYVEQAVGEISQEAVETYYEAHKDPEFLVEEDQEEDEGAAEDETPEGETPEDEAPDEEDPKEFKPLARVRYDIIRTLAREKASMMARQKMIENVAEIRSHREPMDLRIWADGRHVRYEPPTGLRTPSQLPGLPGIGQARQDDTRITDVAFALKELVGAEQARLAVGEISEVFTHPETGAAYAFRVTRFRPSYVPETLEQVRAQVAEDLRRQEALKLAEQAARDLVAKAAEMGGLEEVAKEADIDLTEVGPLPREELSPYFMLGDRRTFVPTVPGVGASRALIEELFKLKEGGRERTMLTLPERDMVVVAELVEREAPRKESYAALRAVMAGEVAQALGLRALAAALGQDAVEARYGITYTTPGVTDLDEAGPEGDAPAAEETEE